jgi:hypothetical protein
MTMATIQPDLRYFIDLSARARAVARLVAAGWQVRLVPRGIVAKRGPAFRPIDVTCS